MTGGGYAPHLRRDRPRRGTVGVVVFSTETGKSLFRFGTCRSFGERTGAMDRKEELIRALGAKANMTLLGEMVDEVIFIEGQLEEIRKLPFIKVHPSNPQLQKSTPAAALYIKLNAQYNSALRTLASLSGQGDGSEDSPLRKWAKKRAGTE